MVGVVRVLKGYKGKLYLSMSLRLVDVNSWLLVHHLESGRRIIAHRLQSGALREGEIAANVELVDAFTGCRIA